MPEGAVKLDMQGTVGGREVQRQRRIEREREKGKEGEKWKFRREKGGGGNRYTENIFC